MGWAGLPDVDQIRPLDEQDRAVLADIRAVLEKHGALQRFGVTLLHSHFDLAPGEILVEEVDTASRILTVRPLEPDAVAGSLTATAFRLDLSDVTPVTLLYCHRPRGSDFHAR